MNWTRSNTPTDAVFSHWWDYGYWVQSMGERATFLDGGNAISYWDYLMGRTITANNESEMMEVLKTHKVTHYLLDSTDIGKYTAFSSIGSDESYDRFSWISTFTLDEKDIIEKKNETVYLFRGGTRLDEDIVYGDQIFIKENSGVAGFLISLKKTENSSVGSMEQPKAIMIINGKQVEVPIKCVYFGQKMIFNEGIDGCLYIMPQVTSQKIMPIGGAMWLSPRMMKSEFSKLYLFDEAENFELVHSENYPIINELNRNYNLNLPEFVLYQGNILGPIKIWKVSYPADIEENPQYLETSYPREGLWKVGGA
jgi:asparagine N-glycosylation enzyme membrane subunit Stt3